MIERYELQEGEEYIDEYIEDDGTHMTILKDKNGEIKHGWSMEIDSDVLACIKSAAAIEGIDTQDFIDIALERAIIIFLEEVKIKQAIEEISD